MKAPKVFSLEKKTSNSGGLFIELKIGTFSDSFDLYWFSNQHLPDDSVSALQALFQQWEILIRELGEAACILLPYGFEDQSISCFQVRLIQDQLEFTAGVSQTEGHRVSPNELSQFPFILDRFITTHEGVPIRIKKASFLAELNAERSRLIQHLEKIEPV